MKKIIIFYGPSGSGKTILSRELLKLGYEEIVGATTRDPRKGEIHTRDYYFFTEEEFFRTEMVEYSEYSGKYYGKPVNEITKKFKKSDKLFAILDKNGVESFKKLYGDLVTTVYIYCPPDILEQRMVDRGESQETIVKRLKNIVATGELSNISLADYVIITNKPFEENLKLLKFMLGEI